MWQYSNPTKVIFGTGSLDQLPIVVKQFEPEKILIVTDRVISQELGLVNEIKKRLLKCITLVFEEVEPNPKSSTIDRAVELARKEQVDLVIGLGGGSSLDAAKLTAALVNNPGLTAEYLTGEKNLAQDSLPMIAIPTTAGTGSEVTSVAVVNNVRDGLKQPIGDNRLYPRIALVDPKLTYSMPGSVTAATGLDALAHALESYWAVTANPVSDLLAMGAAELILNNLRIAYDHPSDILAREKMAMASTIAGLAFSQTKTTGPHAVSYVLTNRFGVPHGVACALTLEQFAVYNYQAIPEKMDRLIEFLHLKDLDGLVGAIAELKRYTKLPGRLSEVGINMEELPGLVKESFHPNMKNNPRPVSAQDLTEMLKSLF